MIELAPNRKQGLTLANPFMAASGAVGFANEATDLVALDQFGAIVTSSISLRPRRGSAQPRLRELNGGILLNHGAQNPGWHRALERFGSAWARSKAPIIAHVVGHTSLNELARRIEGARSIAGLEYDVENETSLAWLAALRGATELPILARLPYGGSALGTRAIEAGADALVCIAPPRGMAMDLSGGQVIEGELFGPLVKALALKTLREVMVAVSAPLIASGGVHASEDVNEFLAAGASAVMIDSLAWIDPRRVNEIVNG